MFAIRYPGTRLDLSDDEEAWRTQNLLSLLESEFTDAAVSLNMFLQARSARSSRAREKNWEEAAERRMRVGERIREEVGDAAYYGDLNAFHERVELESKREAWEAGIVPDSYQRRTAFILAHAFLYAVDAFGKILNVLAGEPGMPAELQHALEQFQEHFPRVSDIRNSALHIEDRGRGQDRHGKPLDLKPMENEAISAPGGGVLALSNLTNDRLGYTLEDGEHAELAVSLENAARLQGVLQQVLDCFAWKGPSRIVP